MLTKSPQRQKRLRDEINSHLLTISREWGDATPGHKAHELRSTIERVVPASRRNIFITAPGLDRRVADLSGVFTPHEALNCIYDIPRTWRFVREIRAVTENFLRKTTGEVVVIDAGCGPCMVLGLTALLMDPQRVRLYCIEKSAFSLQAARLLCVNLGLAARVSFINKDARQVTTRDLFGDSDFYRKNGAHIIISETFGAGLLHERGPEILKHLSRLFLLNGGVVIPERYGLAANAGLYKNGSPQFYSLGQFLSHNPRDTQVERTIPVCFERKGKVALKVSTVLGFSSLNTPELGPRSGSLITKPVHIKDISLIRGAPTERGRVRSTGSGHKIKIVVNLQPHFDGRLLDIDAVRCLSNLRLTPPPVQIRRSVNLSSLC